MNFVVHCKREPFDVYIGRPSKWGNPFKIGRDDGGTYSTREQVIELYKSCSLSAWRWQNSG